LRGFREVGGEERDMGGDGVVVFYEYYREWVGFVFCFRFACWVYRGS